MTKLMLPKNILVPIDFSEYGESAIEYAVDMAQQLDATLHLLHVVTFPVYGVPEIGLAHANAVAQKAVTAAYDKLEEIANRLRDRCALAPIRVETGDARDVIDQVAKECEADLIVMGTHGRRGLPRWIMGSVAESVVRSAPCPVLTVHQDKRAA